MLQAAVRGVAVGRAMTARDALVVNVWGQWLEVAGLNLNLNG
jgi:hypothetical protein